MIPYSKIKAEIARILKQEGYISNYEVDTTGRFPQIKVTKVRESHLSDYGPETDQQAGLRKYVGAGEIPRVLGGMGISILSTPRGIVTGVKPRSKTLAANCWPTFGKELVMSRIGKKFIELPEKVKLNVSGDGAVQVEGPKGKLSWTLPGEIMCKVDGKTYLWIVVTKTKVRALHGLSRALVNNMVTGVSAGFVKDLEIQGVGFKAAVQGKTLKLNLGFSHDILFPIPEGIKVTVTENTKIKIEGIDKRLVGQVAADIRSFYPPEPYKGKGVRYVGEQVQRKEGKDRAINMATLSPIKVRHQRLRKKIAGTPATSAAGGSFFRSTYLRADY